MQPIAQLLVLYLNKCKPNSTYAQVARYVLENIEKVIHMNSHELAEASFVSQSTVSRFIVTLGFSSYKEFIDSCNDYLNNTQLDYLKNDYSKLNWHEKIDFQMEHLTKTMESLDPSIINKLLEEIHNASEIYIVASGHAVLTAYEFQVTLYDMKKPTYIFDDLSKIPYIHEIKNSSLVIVLSAGGKVFSYYRKLLSELDKTSAPKFLITESDDPNLKNHFDHIMRVYQGDQTLDYFAFRFILTKVVSLYYHNYYQK